LDEPRERTKVRSHLAINLDHFRRRHAKKVALCHLRGSPLNNWEAHLLGNLIDYLALANAMATTNEDGLPYVDNVRSALKKTFEVYCHAVLNPLSIVSIVIISYPEEKVKSFFTFS
jgi:hypothetical protein